MMMEFDAQRVSPSPQELDEWLRSTELDGDGSCVGMEVCVGSTPSSNNLGFVSPEVDDDDVIAFERTRTRLLDTFTRSQFRLPFSQQDFEPRRVSLDDGHNPTCTSPRDVSSHHCFVMALERSQQSQAEIDRHFDSSDSDDYSRRNSFNAALLTARSRRMLLDSSAALFRFSSSSTNTTTTSEGIQSNGLRPPYEYHFGRRPNHVANMGEDRHASSPSPLTQFDLDWNVHGQHYQRQHQQNSGRAVGNNSGTRSNRVNSWTHRDMLSMLRTLADDYDNDIATKRRCNTGDLYPEDAVRAELLRIEREQLEYEEARLGL